MLFSIGEEKYLASNISKEVRVQYLPALSSLHGLYNDLMDLT